MEEGALKSPEEFMRNLLRGGREWAGKDGDDRDGVEMKYRWRTASEGDSYTTKKCPKKRGDRDRISLWPGRGFPWLAFRFVWRF